MIFIEREIKNKKEIMSFETLENFIHYLLNMDDEESFRVKPYPDISYVLKKDGYVDAIIGLNNDIKKKGEKIIPKNMEIPFEFKQMIPYVKYVNKKEKIRILPFCEVITTSTGVRMDTDEFNQALSATNIK